MWLSSFLGSANNGDASPFEQDAVTAQAAYQQQRHTLTAFVMVAAFNSLRAYVPATGVWKSARLAMLAVAVSYVAFIGIFISRDAIMLLPRLLSTSPHAPISPALSWCAAAYAMLLLQLISLHEVQDAIAARVTTPKGRRVTFRRRLASRYIVNTSGEDNLDGFSTQPRVLRVLAVEDDRLQQLVIGKLFKEHTIEFAKTAEEALGILGSSNGNTDFPNMILMDKELPGMDGLKATEEIAGKWPDLHIFLTTGASDSETVSGTFMAGARDYLHKPLTRDKLNQAVAPYFPGAVF